MDNNHLKIDKSLLQAYQRADYVVPEIGEILHIGKSHPVLDAFLAQHLSEQWAFISAFNPYSNVKDELWNKARQQELKKLLLKEGYAFLEAYGRDPEGEWPPEDNFLVMDISAERAVAIGKAFEQNAILVGTRGEAVRLVFCI